MPKIQLNMPEILDDKIKHYMIDNKIIDKRIAIIQILKKQFGVTIRYDDNIKHYIRYDDNIKH